MKRITTTFLTLSLLFIGFVTHAQVGIGTTNPNTNSLLEISSVDKGFLMPRIALTATNSPAPLTANVEGMTVYNTATSAAGPNQVTPGFYVNNGTKWVKSTTEAWSLIGNSGTSILNFLGTTDNTPLRFKVNNIPSGIIDPIGKNSFFGYQAGMSSTGTQNVGIGENSLKDNVLGANNTAMGFSASLSNTSGNNNSSYGAAALVNNTTGSSNVAVGLFALLSNTTGNNNTGIGFLSNVGTANLTNATAIGSGALVNANNSLVLGSIAPAVKVGIGVSAPTNALHIIAATNPLRLEGLQNNTATSENLITVDGTGVVHKSVGTIGNIDFSRDEWINTLGRVELGKLSDGTNRPSGTEFVALDNGKVGIGLTNPSAKLEVNSGVANTSGLKLTQLTSSSAVSTGATLGVDGSGNVITVAGSTSAVVFIASLGNGSGGTTNATISASGFNTVTLPNVTKNVGGGTWNTSNYTYTVPISGTYIIKSTIRLTDNSISRNIFQAVATTNADIPDGIWQTNSGNRWTMLYTRIADFNSGDLLRLYIYSDGQTANLSDASLNIALLSEN